MGKIFYIMGKSATGKDTIYKELSLRFQDSLKNIVSYTTRPIREGETQGVEYFFVTEAEAGKLQQEGKVIELREYQTVKGPWKYFTVSDDQIDLSKNDYLVIGTLESYLSMRKFFGEETMIPVYIEVEDGNRLERAVSRERQQVAPNFAEVCRRYLADEQDFSEDKLIQAGITKRFENKTLETAVSEIASYIVSCLDGAKGGTLYG
ncbi:MAG: guanylate kinase [Lachnospiraceae bacterium]|jgi:guanylate kinase|nr:guanylate kinase [Lachnospiraceae bacterium]